MDAPKLVNIEQVCDGWVKKHLLTYEMPDGSLYQYHCATRRDADAYRAGLERNAQTSAVAMEAIRNGEQPPAAPEFTPDAVCIAARTPRDTLVMIREFRYPLNSWCVAFPAGLVDAGESIIACADRELREETGYSLVPGTTPRALPQPGYSSTGLTDETVHVVFMEAEKAEEAHTEGNELIEVFELPIAGIRTFLDNNTLPIGTRAQLILEIFAAQQA